MYTEYRHDRYMIASPPHALDDQARTEDVSPEDTLRPPSLPAHHVDATVPSQWLRLTPKKLSDFDIPRGVESGTP